MTVAITLDGNSLIREHVVAIAHGADETRDRADAGIAGTQRGDLRRQVEVGMLDGDARSGHLSHP